MRGTRLTILVAALTLAATVKAASPPEPAKAPIPSDSVKEVMALVQAGKVDEAIATGRTAITEHPDDVGLRLVTARAMAGKGRKVNHLVNVKVSQADIDKGQTMRRSRSPTTRFSSRKRS